MTLTLGVSGWLLCMTHHLAMKKNCVITKFIQAYMCKTQPRHVRKAQECLSQNCDLDLASRWLGDVHDTLSCYGE